MLCSKARRWLLTTTAPLPGTPFGMQSATSSITVVKVQKDQGLIDVSLILGNSVPSGKNGN